MAEAGRYTDPTQFPADALLGPGRHDMDRTRPPARGPTNTATNGHRGRSTGLGPALAVGRRNLRRLVVAYLIIYAIGLAVMAVVGAVVLALASARAGSGAPFGSLEWRENVAPSAQHGEAPHPPTVVVAGGEVGVHPGRRRHGPLDLQRIGKRPTLRRPRRPERRVAAQPTSWCPTDE